MMSKYFKNLLVIVIGIIFLVLAGCGGILNGDDDNDEDPEPTDKALSFKTKEEIAASLTNYSFKYVINSTDDEGEKVSLNIVDIRCDKGWYFEMDEMVIIADFDDKSYYMLNKDELMTGIKMDLPNDGNDSFKNSSAYLFGWHEYKSDFKKAGSAVVAGRNCEKYTYNYRLNSIKFTYYIDNEYDICLKYEYEGEGEGLMSMTFTEFKIGGVTIQSIIKDLGDYEITDLKNLG